MTPSLRFPAGKECSVTVSPEATSSTGGVALSMYPHTMFSGPRRFHDGETSVAPWVVIVR